MDIQQKLNFKFKLIEDKLILYKEFTTQDLYNLLKETGDIYYIYNLLNDFGEQVANGNEKVKNLILTALLKNLNKNIQLIENNDISDNYEVNIYYTNYNEVKEYLNNLEKEDIVIQLGL